MPETEPPNASPESNPPRGQDEVALELMKFIAVATGYGKSSQGGAGFSGKPQTRAAEEHAEALLELFQRCRAIVKKKEA
jgi:hypothetical protein